MFPFSYSLTKMVYGDTIWLNVEGQRFWTKWSTLRQPMSSRLARLTTSDQEYDPHANEFRFDHSGTLFDCILDVHRNGSLHIPHYICVPKVLEEMKFWEVPVEHVAACCWHRIREYQCELDRIAVLREAVHKSKVNTLPQCTRSRNHDTSTTENNTCEKGDKCSMIFRLRKCMWLLLEVPHSSIFAMVRPYYESVIMIGNIYACVCVVCMSVCVSHNSICVITDLLQRAVS